MIFQPAFLDAIGVAVLHFLWQGLLIGGVTWIVLAMLRKSSFAARYAVAYGALLCSFVAFLATLFLSVDASATGGLLTGTGMGAIDPAMFDELISDLGPSAATITAWLWAAGVFCMGLRFGLQCFAAQRLKSFGVSAPGEEWSQIFEQLKSDLGIGRAVRFLRSSVAEVPMVIPHFALLFGFFMIFVAIVVRFRAHVSGTLASEFDALIQEHSEDDPAADGAKN